MSSTAPRFGALLLAAALVLASIPTTTAEPGKDPNGKSAEAPGQQTGREHGHDRQNPDPDDGNPESDQGSTNEGEPDTDFRLNVLLDDVAAVNDELLRVVSKHLEAGVPVTLEPGPGIFNDTMPDFGDLEDLLDSAALLPSPPQAPQPGAGTQAMNPKDCDLLVYGIMEEPPFLDAGVRLECLPPVELPLDKVPTPRAPELPVKPGIHLD